MVGDEGTGRAGLPFQLRGARVTGVAARPEATVESSGARTERLEACCALRTSSRAIVGVTSAAAVGEGITTCVAMRCSRDMGAVETSRDSSRAEPAAVR